jgi:putative ABC transport system permease protein
VRFLHRLLSLGRNLVRPQECERQLADELSAHLDLLIEEKVRAGLSLAVARREALLEFGGIEQVKERVRRVRRGYYIESLVRDFRNAGRSLLRAPGFGIVAVLTLAIGSGAAIAMFSIFDAALGRPLNFVRPEELLSISEHSVEQGLRESHLSFPKFTALREEKIFTEVAAYSGETAMLQGARGMVQVPTARVTGTLFALLCLQPERGELFGAAETRDVALLTHQCWQNRFASDEAVIGAQILINGRNHTVTGVLPADLSRPLSQFELLLPGVRNIDFLSPEQIARGAGYLHVIGRCAAGEMIRLPAALQRVDERYRRAFPDNMDAMFSSGASDLTRSVTREIRPSLYALGAAMGCLFTLACLNVGCLFLARFATHREELVLRAALGAEHRRLVQHLFSEITIIAGGGLALGLGISAGGMYALRLLNSPLIPFTITQSITPRAMVFAGLLFGLISIALTLACAMHAGLCWRDVALSSPSARRIRSNRLGSAFVVGQIALSLVLLLAAGLLLSTLQRIRDVKVGFDSAGVIIADMSSLPSRYSRPVDYATFVEGLTRSLESLPGVNRAALVYGLPLAQDDTYILCTSLDKKMTAVRDRPTSYFRVISPGYFEAMRIPLTAGRAFSSRDNNDNPNVVIISQATARMLFGASDPIGQKVICGGTVQAIHEVIGVVGDVRSTDVTSPSRPEMYFSIFQQMEPTMKLVVQTTGSVGNAQALTPVINKCIQALDPQQPALEFESMQQLVSKSVAHRRLLALVLAVLAALALVLAMVGTYGVMSFAVVERRREIGLRLALGATGGGILRLIFARGFKLTIVGVLIGTALALAGARFFSGLLFDVSPTDPTIFVASISCLAALTSIAIYLPARRAMRVDPIIALRA